MKADKSLTKSEEAAIRRLQRLAATWPETLSLLSWSGSLVVVPTDERDEPRPERCVSIDGIPNDGGDPDQYVGEPDGADWYHLG